MGTDERAIRELHFTWIDAVNKGDLVGLLNSMSDDVVFLGPGETPSGRDAFLPRFTAAHQQARINCVSELQDVVVIGEVAYTLSRDTLSVTPLVGGEEMRLAGYRSTVYRKQHTGVGSLSAIPTRYYDPVSPEYREARLLRGSFLQSVSGNLDPFGRPSRLQVSTIPILFYRWHRRSGDSVALEISG
jgi:uncharacterized protein (TIGR02246 family)